MPRKARKKEKNFYNVITLSNRARKKTINLERKKKKIERDIFGSLGAFPDGAFFRKFPFYTRAWRRGVADKTAEYVTFASAEKTRENAGDIIKPAARIPHSAPRLS